MEGKKMSSGVLKYRKKAQEELGQLKDLLKMGFLFLCVSRCYYAAFYAMKAALENIGIKTSSHKQTQISFRKHFIKTGEIGRSYSKILTELFESRSKADYDIHWAANKPFVERIIRETGKFVNEVLGII